MAFAKIFFSSSTVYGQTLRNGLTQFENGLRTVADMRDAMTMMIDGDGSNATQFPEVTTRFGFPDNATAKAGWDELNSCLAKQFTDSSVTSVNAAREQLFDKLR